jgi:ABC-2 type transport system permease protein
MGVEGVRGRLRHLLALWGLYARMDVLWIARGPRAALSWYLTDALTGFAAVVATFLLAARFDGIGAWSRDQVLFMLGFAMMGRGVVEVVFGWNVGFISRRIGRGQLDHMLLQPQPLWVTVLGDGFSPLTGSGQLVAGTAVVVWATRALELAPGPGWLALCAVHLVSSVVIMLSFAYLVACLAFLAPRGAEEINSSSWRLMQQLGAFPLDGLGAALTGGLLAGVPAGFVAWFPSRVLLGLDPGPGAVAWTPLAALLFACLAAASFQLGLRHYGRTGSTRYLAHGHRR